MLKNNKGITLISLVVTIILLLILASISINAGTESLTDAKYYKGIANIKTMQSKVNELYEEYKNGDTSILQYGTQLNQTTQELLAYNTVKEIDSNIGNLEDFRYYSTQYIKNDLGLEGVEYDFIINIKTRAVILVDGLERNRKKYYALCQVEGEQYNIYYQEEE